ncbi:MAG: hypothetical protein DWQ30_21295 [Acidobacteria bacterium]|nr:MAG: hypothetical protein DWQ30_21295 [Acidobacteriota bacterium]
MSGDRSAALIGAAVLLVASAGAAAGQPQATRSEGRAEEEGRAASGHEAGDEKDDEDDGDAKADAEHGEKHSSRLSAERIPLQIEDFPQRPEPLLELGEPFLGTGTLSEGIELPTGAVWQPAFLVFGSLRVAAQVFDDNDVQTIEAPARLDLFGNLQLSGTERLVIGLRSLDEAGRFTSYVVESDGAALDEGFQDELNTRLGTLFFEGDFGEIFPNLSRSDFKATDWGFSVGRQPLVFQDGFLINDVVDCIGITRNTLLPRGTSNFRATLFYAWNNLHRADRSAGRANLEDDDARLLALLTSTDVRRSTIDVDLAWLDASRDGASQLNLGLSGVQRIGKLATSLFLAHSSATDGEGAVATDGSLVFGEVSWIPHGTKDHPYIAAFAAFDDYAPVVRDPALGGPLGRVGISFAAVGLGNYGAPLSSQARDVAGGAVGYQWFAKDKRSQWIAELGLRVGTASDVADAAAATFRYQRAFGRRFVIVADSFVGVRESLIPGEEDASSFGGRLELLTKF